MTTKESTSSASSPTAMGPQSINKELEEMTEGPLFTNGVSAYRAHFSCRYVGSVRARSKRKITWYVPLLVGESLLDPVNAFMGVHVCRCAMDDRHNPNGTAVIVDQAAPLRPKRQKLGRLPAIFVLSLSRLLRLRCHI